jgi:hypothetical protein
MRAWAFVCGALCLACGGGGAEGAPVSAPVLPSVPPPPAPIAAPVVAHTDPPWQGEELFRVRVEQDGAEVPILNHRVALARHAFTFAFELQGIDTVDVNASYAPTTLEMASKRASLDGPDQPFGPGHGAAEEVDPPHGVFVDDESFNLWGWSGDLHRCHVHETPPGAGFFVCKRIVELLRSGPSDTKVEASTARALYLVFFSGEPPAEGGREREREQPQYDWLTITFN